VTSKMAALCRGHDRRRLSTACFACAGCVETSDWWCRATASCDTDAAILVGRQCDDTWQ